MNKCISTLLRTPPKNGTKSMDCDFNLEHEAQQDKLRSPLNYYKESPANKKSKLPSLDACIQG